MDYLIDWNEQLGFVYILQPTEEGIILGFALLLGVLLLHNFWAERIYLTNKRKMF